MLTTRRRIATAAAAALTTSLAACGGGSSTSGAPDETLAITMWGGTAQTAHVDSYFTPWAEANGVSIQQDSPTDYAKIKAQVEAGKVSWGVVEVEPNYANTACAEGLLEKLPASVTDAATEAGVDPAQIGECGIPNLQYAFNIAYNTDTFPDEHPTTWAEFFDTEAFPGNRGFWKYATGGIFEAALLADGVAPDELYPLDLDRAFAKLDTIKSDIVFYDTGDQQAQLVASGEAPLVQAWNGRISQAAQAGQPVANEWGEHFVSYDRLVVLKGYENAELAMEWMTWFLENPWAQADDAVASAYAPVVPAALDLVPEDARKELPGYPANAALSAGGIDYGYWAENYNEVTERFNAWILG